MVPKAGRRVLLAHQLKASERSHFRSAGMAASRRPDREWSCTSRNGAFAPISAAPTASFTADELPCRSQHKVRRVTAAVGSGCGLVDSWSQDHQPLRFAGKYECKNSQLPLVGPSEHLT